MKRVAILGSTGSIGQSALLAIRSQALPLRVVSLAANSSTTALLRDGQAFGVEAVCLSEGTLEPDSRYATYSGPDGIRAMLATHEVDIVLNAISGFAGLRASLEIIEAGYDLALANKESIVCGGALLFDAAYKAQVAIIPVDSEHSALAALLAGQRKANVSELILTASGGPFLHRPAEEFSTITVADTLAHPTWQMGSKITVDSATLANKALEVIEASYLFGFKGEAIKVLIHPQSVVHSLIGTVDGAYYGQLSVPDMRLAITAALLDEPLHRIEPLDFSALTLEFFTPRWDVFPLLGLAYEILERSDSSAIAFNAADEVAVAAFLDTQISYLKMVEVVQRTVDRPWDGVPSTYEEILAVDQAARKRAEELI